MPRLTRWMLRASLLYLLAALLLRLALVAPEGPWGGEVGLLAPIWIHLLVLGFATQLIFGVAHWMFPRFSSSRPRGFEGLLELAFVGLNGGLLLRAFAEPLLGAGAAGPWRSLLVLSAALQGLALLAFISNLWPRVRGR